MIDATKTKNAEQSAQPVDKLYMENTLLRVAGALFCHDAKRAPMRTSEIELNRGAADKKIVVRPDPRLGQPGPLAHKIFIALIKKHSSYGRPIQSDVSFTKRELMRLIGRQEWGGRDGEQLVRALNEIHRAFVKTSFKGANGRYSEHSFNIFPEIYLERAESATDPVEKCTVTLARPIIASLQDEHFTCLNYMLMQQLGTIGQALYMRLFFHFANLFDGHHRSRLSFPKRYDDICTEWLGGLTVHKHRSIIERDQLGPHLRQLAQVGFLASSTITKTARGDGFVVTFRPGAAFFADYDRFYRGRYQASIQYEFHEDRREMVEPLKVPYLFTEKRTGQPVSKIPYVSSKEVETAKHLLARLPFENMSDFLDHALAAAKKTNYSVQTLGGIRRYLDDYLKSRDRRAATMAAGAARRAQEEEAKEWSQYSCFRRAECARLFSTLPADEQAVIEELARAKAPARATKTGSIAEIVLGLDKARITAERHPDRILSFDQWKARATSSESGRFIDKTATFRTIKQFPPPNL